MASESLRRLARRGVPLGLRQVYAQACRRWRDSISGNSFQNENGGGNWPVRTELVQIVIPGQLYENKLSNLRRGASLIDQSLIKPGGRWSFWGRIGKPSLSNGFVEG